MVQFVVDVLLANANRGVVTGNVGDDILSGDTVDASDGELAGLMVGILIQNTDRRTWEVVREMKKDM